VRVYYLHLTRDNFIVNGNQWESAAIDLYDNNYYSNYSTVKSNYGVHTANGYTWIGLFETEGVTWRTLEPFTWDYISQYVWKNQEGQTTSSGRIRNGRFIDYSGRASIIGFGISDTSTAPVMDVYQSDNGDRSFPEEWVARTGFTPADEFGIDDADEYAKFVVTFPRDPGDVELYIRIEIDEPVIDALFSHTQDVLTTFPKWMAMREFSVDSPATPALAVPSSVGGKFINSIAGEWLDDISQKLTYSELQHYIGTLDLNQKAWVYKTTGVPDIIWDIWGDYDELGIAVDLEELYQANPDEHVVYWDENAKILYSNLQYDSFSVNGYVYTQTPHHVWNWIDDLGLNVDLHRLYLEDNDSFRLRIADTYVNKPGAGIEQFKLALRRELNLWKYEGATPSSDYLGATPTILEMDGIETDPKYMNLDGIPTKAFVDLVEDLSRRSPTTWGRFKWDRAIWDIGGEEGAAYQSLPIRLDATPVSGSDVQAGIGDSNDLYVHRPDVVAGPHDFATQLVVRGKQRELEVRYLPVQVNLNVYGTANKRIYNNPATSVWLTMEIRLYTTDATPVPGTTYAASFDLTSISDVDMANPVTSISSYANQRIFAADGAIDPSLTLVDKITGQTLGSRPLAGEIYQITLKSGKWDVDTQTYIDTAVTDVFTAWFSVDPFTTLTYNTGAPMLTGDSATPTSMGNAFVQMSSKQVSYTVDTWTSEKVPYSIEVNSLLPYTTPDTYDLQMPSIAWDNYLDIIPHKQYILELTTLDPSGSYGAMVQDPAVFLPSTYISVDGDNIWVDGQTKTLPGTTTAATFSIGSGADYPISNYYWNLFERTQLDSYLGIVDENGPWRDGEAPPVGNTNFTFLTPTVDRNDFGIPLDDPDYVITWIGVNVVGDGQVIAWLDNNTVIEDDNSFGTVVIRARLRTDPEPKWNPQINSGWFYEGDHDYYLYAKSNSATVASNPYVLSTVARQGAPIIIWDGATPYRQVAFYDQDASPIHLSLTNTEIIEGNGATPMFLAYPDVYDVVVNDISEAATPVLIEADTSSITNVIETATPTDKTHKYQVSYVVNNSFYAENDYETAGAQATRLQFDQPATGAIVTYETAIFNPATPVDLPLSPLFTNIDKGFIFISHNEETLDQVSIKISPSKIIADGQDYLIVVLKAVDRYDNPKANQNFTLTTTFGTFDDSTVTTNRDGTAIAILRAASTTTSLRGTITVAGAVNASMDFDIDIADTRRYRLTAVVNTDQMPANGEAQNIIYCRLEDGSFVPVTDIPITWKRARTVYDLFGGVTMDSGSATPGINGGFTIGPFTSATPTSGYWFVAIEAAATPKVGDVVFWYEYPDSAYGVNSITGLPQAAVQMSTPTLNPPYANMNRFPAYYDEDNPDAPATPVTINWLPPQWYPLDRYQQYQLGLLGSTPNTVDPNALPYIHPSYGVI
jgi:hypothetical protein